jgi:hypothetical protein
MTTTRFATREAFRHALMIPDGRGGLVAYGSIEERWQRDKIWLPLDARRPDGTWQHHLVYLQLARGHAKTFACAAEALTVALFEPETRVDLYACDREQATLPLEFLKQFLKNTPDLAQYFEVERQSVRCIHTNSLVQVLSSDAKSAYGRGGLGQAYVVITDELWAWEDDELWDAVYSGALKLPNWRIIAATNAGFNRESACWKVHELARTHREHYYFAPRGQVAAWLGKNWTKEMRAGISDEGRYRRLVENVWITQDEQGIPAEQIRIAFDGWREPAPTETPDTDWKVIGIDYAPGTGGDATAVAVAGYDWDAQRLRVEEVHILQGQRAKPVLVADVGALVARLRARYRVERVILDPYQIMSLAQELGREAHVFNFSVSSKEKLAAALLELMREGRIILPPEKVLRRELEHLVVKPTITGSTLEHVKGEHNDATTAVALCAWFYTRPEAHRAAVLSFGKLDHSVVPGRSAVGIAQGKTPIHWDADAADRAALQFPKCEVLGCERYHRAEISCRDAVKQGESFDKEYPFRTRTTLERQQTGLR